MTLARRFSQRAQFFGRQPISELMRLALARPELISLAAGFVDQASLPVAEVQQAIDGVLDDLHCGRAALQYGTNAGFIPLRQAVLSRLLTADAHRWTHPPNVDRVILTAGSNQLLHLVGEVLLDPGDVVLCAAPTYFVYLGQLSGFGAQAVGIAIDDEGMIPDALAGELERFAHSGQLERVKAIYVTSYFENPSTATLPLSRRAAIVELAKRYSREAPIYVIDDSAYRDLRYAGDDLPSLGAFDDDGTTVIVAETFSKSFSPGVRIGWGVLPQDLVAPVSALKASIDFGSPNLNQHLMAAVLERGLLEPHIALLRAAYQTKLEAMLQAMDEFLSGIPGIRWQRPSGGLYVWLELPEGMDAGPGGTLIEHALAEGVLYVPGEYCYPPAGQAARKDRIRLSFGVQTAENIHRGIKALARAIEASCSRP
jgi:2-aminoadipate transaminase